MDIPVNYPAFVQEAPEASGLILVGTTAFWGDLRAKPPIADRTLTVPSAIWARAADAVRVADLPTLTDAPPPPPAHPPLWGGRAGAGCPGRRTPV
jgi:hypothetical protein